MAGTGLGINGIMLVGEAPGQTENEQGRPFIGRAGQLLDRALKDAGIDRAECYTSYAVKCWTGEGDPMPFPSELNACLPYLLEEIEEYQPRVILCLGNAAMMALTGKDKITRERGRVLPPRKGLRITAPIMATFHPSYALRNPSAYQEIVSDLRALTPHSPDRATSVIVTPDTQEPSSGIAEAIDAFLDCKLITVDLEWSTGDKKKSGETAMAWPWTPGAEAFSISIAGRINGTINSIALGLPLQDFPRQALARLLSTVPGVYHNAMADLIWLLGMGFQPRYGADTMILAYLIDETQARTLAAVATKYGGLSPEWKRDAQRLYHTRDEINWPELLGYNAEDVRATLLAFEGLREHINASPRRSQILGVHNRILAPVIPILANAAVVGVPIDTELLLAEGQACTKRRNAAIESLSASTGLLPAQAAKLAASSKQIQEYVNGALGLNIENAEAETLMPYRAYPAIKDILKIKKESKFSQTYFEPWRILTSRQEDGRLHTIYRPVGTVTGRLSAELEMGGSIHVAPRNEARSVREKYDRDPIQFRRLIKAAPGRVIVAVDASQVELRTIAWLAPEPTMRRLYNDDPNADLHLRTAIEINRKKAMEAAGDRPYHEAVEYLMREGKDALGERLPEWKDYRQSAKSVGFGYCIAAGQRVLTDQGLVPIELVTKRHSVWDGVEWVKHEGLVRRGRCEVVRYGGLVATPDHEVWTTTHGKVPFWRAASEGLQLVRSGEGSQPVTVEWYTFCDTWDGVSRRTLQTENGSNMFGVRSTKGSSLGLREGRVILQLSLSRKQIQSRSTSGYAWDALRYDRTTMHTVEPQFITSLHRPRYTKSISIERALHTLGVGNVSGFGLQRVSVRSHRQRRALRTEQLAFNNVSCKQPQQEEAETFDLLNAGPRRRFTCEGKLVSNSFGMREEKFVTYARTNYEVEFTLQEAQEARAAYMRLYSGLEPWHRRAMQSADSLGWAETPFGRRRKFTEDDLLASINYPVQSAANDLTAISMGQVDLSGLDAVIIGTIHDSILVDSSERDADEVKRRLVWAMENPDLTPWGITLPVPLVADASVSQVWK